MQKLIILHGWGGNKQTWQKFTDVAQEHYDVHIIELPCFGDEPCPNEIWGVEEYAEFVKEKVESIKGKEPVILLGHSFGGQIATVLATKHPELVDKLILSGAAIIRPKKHIKRGLFFVIAKCGKLLSIVPGLSQCGRLAKKILYLASKSPDFSKTKGIKSDIFKKIIRQDVQHYLPQIQAETLVIWGENDDYVPLRYGKRIATQIPNARFEIIPEGTHGLHIKKINELLKKIHTFTKKGAGL